MSKLYTYEKVYVYALAMVVFFQTVFPKLAPLTIVLLLLVVLFGVTKGFFKWHFNAMNVLFFGLYIAYLVGVLFTKDPQSARDTLEIKLSFVLFPFLFSFKPNFAVQLRIPAIGMIFGVIVAACWGIYKLLSCLSAVSFIDCLPYFSDLHHPSYFAVYIVFSMALVLYGYIKQWKGFSLSLLVIYWGFGIGISILAFSLSGILFLVLLIGVLIWWWLKKKYGWKLTIGLTAIVLAAFIALIAYSPIKEDFKYTSQSFSLYLDSPEQFVRNGNRYLIGNEVRLILWTITAEIIAEHPFGVGTGNVDIFLMEKLQSYGLNDLTSYKYNPHNQFLQTFLEIGIVGVIFLLGIIILGIYTAIKTKNWLLLFVVVSLFFNSLFESMLQRQSGIVFYTFWICLLSNFSLILNNNSK